MIEAGLSFLLLAAIAKSCPNKDKDIIVWQADRKLQWADFKDTVKSTKHINLAFTTTRLLAKYKMEGQQLVDYDIVCIFEKKFSWIRDTSRRVLEHEQGHFDMGELAARRYRKACSSLLYTKQVNREFMDSVFGYYHQQLIAIEEAYDSTIKQDGFMQPVLLE